MDKIVPLTDLSKPEQLTTLTDAISEMADELDVLYSTTSPNGAITGRQGRICLYNNSGAYTLWVNTDGATAWQQIGAIGGVTPGTLTNPQTPAEGTSTVAMRADAKHGIPTPATPTTQAFGDSATSGAGTGFSTDTHKHGFPSTPAGFTNMQAFASSGTWTRPAGVTKVFACVIGAGGGGGEGGIGGGGSGSGGGGGSSSFGSLVVAAGGSGGGGGGSAASGSTAGGAGGAASAGDLQLTGATGGSSYGDANLTFGGEGAASNFGGGGSGARSYAGVGTAAVAKGSGGGGGGGVNATNAIGGGGGGSGGYAEGVVTVSGDITVTVGTGGTGGSGTAGGDGAAGAAGLVVVYWAQ